MTLKPVFTFVVYLVAVLLLVSCGPAPAATPTVLPSPVPPSPTPPIATEPPLPAPTVTPEITITPLPAIDEPIDGLVNGDSYAPGISADGRWVVYASFASNLVADDLNDQPDIFLYDRVAKSTLLISRGLDGDAC